MNVELTAVLNLDKINVSGMIAPKPEKLSYYEKYFLRTGHFANPVIVDEGWNIRAGYVTYLLAKKYGVRPQIFEVRASRPLTKVVRGRYVKYIAWEWKPLGTKQNSWIYTLRESVVPGDILRVESPRGTACMQVEEIGFTDGMEGGDGMRKALKHIKKSKNVLESVEHEKSNGLCIYSGQRGNPD